MTSLEMYREKIAHLEDEGYDNLCLIGTKDMLGHRYDYLYMWKKNVDGKIDWVEIGPLRDQDSWAGGLYPLDKNNVSICPPVVRPEVILGDESEAKFSFIGPLVMSPGSHDHLTHPSKEQPDEKNVNRLRDDFAYYKTNNVIRLKKIGGSWHLMKYEKGDIRGKGRGTDLGLYEELNKICEELDIDISCIRWLKAEGYHFRLASSGALTARAKGGERDEIYIGVYEGPIVDLCKKNGIKIKNE